MAMSLHAFCQWLGETPLSLLIQNVSWVIPSMQSVHIVSIAIVISSSTVLGLRLLGVVGKSQPTAAYAARFLPWIWYTLPVLLVTGSILIIGEPARSLENPAFQTKMVLLILAIIATFALNRPLAKDPAYWELTPGHQTTAKVIAVISLILWCCIIFCGRWIAYMNVSGE
jgi:hypothetical protein